MKISVNSFAKTVEWIAIVFFVCMCTMVFTQVVARYIFNNPIFWAEEFSLSVFSWVAFIGAALALRKSRHARVTFLVNLFPRRTKKRLEIFTHFLVGGVSLLILVQSIRFFGISNTIILTALNIPASYVSLSVSLGSFLMIIFSMEALIKAFKESSDSHMTEDSTLI